jgi:hypothetical protein
VAHAVYGLPDAESAERLPALVENPKTEGIVELDWTQEYADSRHVRIRKKHTATARDDTVVVIAEVEPLSRSPQTDWSDIAEQMVL